MKEEWRPIKGFENLYEVSNMGRVRSLGRIRIRYASKGAKGPKFEWNYKPRYLKPIPIHNAYKVNLHTPNDEQKGYLIAHLVANAFIVSEPACITHVYYVDGDPSNCQVSNLIVHTRKG